MIKNLPERLINLRISGELSLVEFYDMSQNRSYSTFFWAKEKARLQQFYQMICMYAKDTNVL